MDVVQLVKQESAERFVDYLRLSNDHWHKEKEVSVKDWVFRGHWDSENWLLVPKAWRPGGSIDAQANRKIQNDLESELRSEAEIEHNRCSYWTEAELRILFEFAKAVDAHDLPVKSEFLNPKSYPPYGTGHLDRLAEIACLAQHHDLPTRLLDWTAASLVAAFWACNPSDRSHTSSELCVWALDRSVLNCAAGAIQERIKFHDVSASTSDYLKAQKGLFSELLGAEDYFQEHGDWPDIVSYLEAAVSPSDTQKPFPRKITLSTDHADRLVLLLSRERISRSYLMPSLDNIARSVIEQF